MLLQKNLTTCIKLQKQQILLIFIKQIFDQVLDLSIGLLYGNLVFPTTSSSFPNYTSLNKQIKTYIQKNNAFYLATLYTEVQKNNFNQQITNNIAFFALMNLAMACSYNDYFDTNICQYKKSVWK